MLSSDVLPRYGALSGFATKTLQGANRDGSAEQGHE